MDTTFATPYLLQAFDFGVDIVCHCATTHLAGHGTTISGIVVEKGGFDWRNGNFPQFERFLDENEGAIDAEGLRLTAFTRCLWMRFLTEFGAHMSPWNAFLVLQGLERLSLRMKRHADNALKVATFLESHPCVREVAYPSLPSSPCHDRASKYFPRGSGAVLGVRVEGGLEGAKRVLERVRIFDYITNVGDTKSLIVHPGRRSTTACPLPPRRASIPHAAHLCGDRACRRPRRRPRPGASWLTGTPRLPRRTTRRTAPDVRSLRQPLARVRDAAAARRP
jgi:O-acetylhomoserine (thiol)-lyase